MKVYLKNNGNSLPAGMKFTVIFDANDPLVSQLTTQAGGYLSLPDNTSRLLLSDTGACGNYFNPYKTHGWQEINSQKLSIEIEVIAVNVNETRRAFEDMERFCLLAKKTAPGFGPTVEKSDQPSVSKSMILT